MMTAARVRSEHDNSVRLTVSSTMYTMLLRELGDASHARLTYDGETLEIMSPGFKHELIADMPAAMIDFASVEWAVELTNFGSATLWAEPRGGVPAIEVAKRIENCLASKAETLPIRTGWRRRLRQNRQRHAA